MEDELWSKYISQSEEDLLSTSGSDAHSVEPMMRLSDAPQIASKQDVAAFLDVIAHSHGCDVKDISYYCEPIIDDDGNVKITEVWLIFNIKSLINGEIVNRQVYSMRIATSQEVQQRAQAMLGKSKEMEQPVANVEPPASAPAPAPAKPKRASAKPRGKTTRAKKSD